MSFRLQGKQHFYTWPQCPLSAQAVVDKFSNQWPVKNHAVCEEKHEDGTPHLHAWFEYTKRIDCRNLDQLHMVAQDGTVYKGHYKKADRNAIGYVFKDGVFITSLSEDDQAAAIAKWDSHQAKGDGWPGVIKLAKGGDIDQALDLLYLVNPRDAVMQGPAKLRGNLSAMSKKRKENPCTDMKFSPPPAVGLWDRTKYSLVLVGPAKTGKTCFAMSCFENPLKCNRFDKLKEFDPKIHDGIVFDDMSFFGFKRDNVVAVTTVEMDSDVNVKYAMVVIPASTPRVFTNNILPFEMDAAGAIARRIHVVCVDTDMRVMDPDTAEADIKPPDDLAAVMESAENQRAEMFHFCGDAPI